MWESCITRIYTLPLLRTKTDPVADRYVNTNNLWRLLAHKHWITIKVLHKEIRLCARCTGYIVGFSAISTLHTIFHLYFLSTLDIVLQLLLYSLFSIPLALDWITQTWKLRKSNNKLRLITGCIIGFGVFLLSLSNASFQTKILFSISLSAGITMLGFVGRGIRSYSTI